MKTFAWILLILYGAYYYVSQKYEFHDTLDYAQKHPEKNSAPAIEYYVGMVYYQRSDYHKAQEAWGALLEQHPTDYYVEKALIDYSEAAQYNLDFETAKVALQKYLDDYPNGKKVDLAKQKLDLVKYNHP
jgi:outer membrane protein assembly factor BamD (BamD/ComL family)